MPGASRERDSLSDEHKRDIDYCRLLSEICRRDDQEGEFDASLNLDDLRSEPDEETDHLHDFYLLSSLPSSPSYFSLATTHSK